VILLIGYALLIFDEVLIRNEAFFHPANVLSQRLSQLSHPQKFASTWSANNEGPNFYSLSPYNLHDVILLSSFCVTFLILFVKTAISFALTDDKLALIKTYFFNNSISAFEYLNIHPIILC